MSAQEVKRLVAQHVAARAEGERTVISTPAPELAPEGADDQTRCVASGIYLAWVVIVVSLVDDAALARIRAVLLEEVDVHNQKAIALRAEPEATS